MFGNDIDIAFNKKLLMLEPSVPTGRHPTFDYTLNKIANFDNLTDTELCFDNAH